MELLDLMYELSHALENHTESDGHEFDFSDFNELLGKGDLVVTAPDGTVSRFQVRIREAN
jgi:hypothetical protein